MGKTRGINTQGKNLQVAIDDSPDPTHKAKCRTKKSENKIPAKDNRWSLKKARTNFQDALSLFSRKEIGGCH